MIENFVGKLINAIQTETRLLFTVENKLLSLNVIAVPDYYELIDGGIAIYSNGDVWELNMSEVEYDDKLECYIAMTKDTKVIVSFE